MPPSCTGLCWPCCGRSPTARRPGPRAGPRASPPAASPGTCSTTRGRSRTAACPPAEPCHAGSVDLAGRLDRFQRRHPGAGFPLAVIYKFVDDQGNYLTAMITYYGFLSLFPLLLLLTSILGFALEGNPGLQEQVLDSALSRFPVLGQQLGDNVQSMHGSTVA